MSAETLSEPLLLATSLPSSVATAVAVVSDGLVIVLLMAVIREWVKARKAPATAMAAALLALCAPLVAYLASETVKSLTEIPRPCQQLELALHTGCPAATDWSFPSNHATVAAAAATAWVMLTSRRSGALWTTTVIAGVAVLAAATRVLLGVHSLVDVLAGLALGSTTALAILWWGTGRANTVSGLRRNGRVRWVVGSD